MPTALLVAGCAGAPVAIEGDAISYAATACYGTCPVYSVSITPDGRGTFVGEHHTAVTGKRTFDAGPGAYAKVEALLAPYRPEAGGRSYSPESEGCRLAPTDMPSRTVTWTSMRGDGQTLSFYDGCRGENAELAAALDAVPRALAITDMVGADLVGRR